MATPTANSSGRLSNTAPPAALIAWKNGPITGALICPSRSSWPNRSRMPAAGSTAIGSMRLLPSRCSWANPGIRSPDLRGSVVLVMAPASASAVDGEQRVRRCQVGTRPHRAAQHEIGGLLVEGDDRDDGVASGGLDRRHVVDGDRLADRELVALRHEGGEPLALELDRVDAEVDEHGDALGGEDDEGVRVELEQLPLTGATTSSTSRAGSTAAPGPVMSWAN